MRLALSLLLLVGRYWRAWWVRLCVRLQCQVWRCDWSQTCRRLVPSEAFLVVGRELISRLEFGGRARDGKSRVGPGIAHTAQRGIALREVASERFRQSSK